MPSAIDERHVWLNSVKYPLAAPYKIAPGWLPRFDEKINTGDLSFATERFISNWITKDLRGGIGVEEMDESKHATRTWFGNINTEFNGHGLLPRLATAATLPTLPTITDGGMEIWTDANNLTNWTYSETFASNSLAQEGTIKQAGSYSANITATRNGGTSTDAQILQTLGNWSNNFRSKLVTVTGYCRTTAANTGSAASIIIDDGVGTTTVSTISLGAFAQFSCVRTLDAAATKIDVICKVSSGTDGGGFSGYFDQVEIAALGTLNHACNYNGGTYYAAGSVLLKATSSTAYALEGIFPTTITALVPSVGNNLLVYLGDSTNYWYISSAGVFADAATGTAANTQNATKGVHWSNKAWKMNAAGQIYHCADPARDDPTWTANGSLADNGLASGDCNNLYVDYNSSGSTVIYAATKKGLFQHDTTNALFLDTKIGIADHTNAGKGIARFNDGLFMSAGLAVKKYRPTSGLIDIYDTGLDQDDGLPTEYNGEIVKFIEGIGTMYALVDASQVTGNGFSAVYGYDGEAWRVIWDASLLNTWTYAFTGNSGASWGQKENSYDNNTTTYGYSESTAIGATSGTATFTIGATNSNRLRFYAASEIGTAGDMRISVSVSTNGTDFTEVYYATWTYNTWVEVPFALRAVTDIRISCTNDSTVSTQSLLLKELNLAVCTWDGTMHSGIVSSVGTYHLSFDHNGAIYSIPLSRNNLNPKKVSSSTYGVYGFLVSPWFDGDTAAFSKALKRLTAFCEDTSSTETVSVRYRLDHTYTDLDTGWTILSAIASDGASEINLASGAGVAFKAFQYRIDLARTTTTTLSPDWQALAASYRRNLGAKQAWTFTVDLSGASVSEREMISNLETAVGSDTWIDFAFRDSTKETSVYVQIADIKGVTGVGPNYKSQYTLTVVEV